MKTIRISDDAYERLKAWKQTSADSFSKVVLKVVPKRGALADLAEEMGKLIPLSQKQAVIMQETVAELNDRKNWKEPWTS